MEFDKTQSFSVLNSVFVLFCLAKMLDDSSVHVLQIVGREKFYEILPCGYAFVPNPVGVFCLVSLLRWQF